MTNKFKLASLTALGLALAACATPNNTQSADTSFMDIEWTVQTLAGSDVLPNAKPTIRFGSDYAISGSGTCNRLVGTYEMNNGKIDIDPLGTTMMLCAPSENTQERAFLEIIDDVEMIETVADGTLVLSTGDGEIITATRGASINLAAKKAQFLCGSTPVSVTYSGSGDRIDLTVKEQNYTLPRVVSASGAKYQKNNVMFWAKADWAMMEINGVSYSECSKT